MTRAYNIFYAWCSDETFHFHLTLPFQDFFSVHENQQMMQNDLKCHTNSILRVKSKIKHLVSFFMALTKFEKVQW